MDLINDNLTGNECHAKIVGKIKPIRCVLAYFGASEKPFSMAIQRAVDAYRVTVLAQAGQELAEATAECLSCRDLESSTAAAGMDRGEAIAFVSCNLLPSAFEGDGDVE